MGPSCTEVIWRAILILVNEFALQKPLLLSQSNGCRGLGWTVYKDLIIIHRNQIYHRCLRGNAVSRQLAPSAPVACPSCWSAYCFAAQRVRSPQKGMWESQRSSAGVELSSQVRPCLCLHRAEYVWCLGLHLRT